MGRNLYIADWHYGHENILAFDNRPFRTVDEMNEQLIDRWNRATHRGDKVYVLGDMFWTKTDVALEVLDKLNGEKYLIKGNHDRCNNSKFKRKFTKICDYDEIDDCGMESLYNHQCNMYNVGAMMPWVNYTPRTLDEIIGGYNEQKAKTGTLKKSETCRNEQE